MKKWALFILLVFLSGPSQAHHRHGHQNTEPWPEFRRADCGKIQNYIIKWETLDRMLRNHGKMLRVHEYKELERAKFLFESVCRVV